MAASSSLLLHNPTCNFYSSSYLTSSRLSSYSSIISPGFLLSVSGSGTMTVKRFSTRAGGSSNDGNEQFGAIEKESFINNSSEIRKDLVAGGGIEAIVNRLVSNGISLLHAMCSMKCLFSINLCF